MKKFKNKIIRIYIDLFEHKIEIIFTDNVYHYRNTVLPKRFPKVGKYENMFYAVHTSLNSAGRDWCILPNGCGVSVVSHEVNHAVDDMVGLYGLEGTEIKSYLFQYIMKKIYG